MVIKNDSTPLILLEEYQKSLENYRENKDSEFSRREFNRNIASLGKAIFKAKIAEYYEIDFNDIDNLYIEECVSADDKSLYNFVGFSYSVGEKEQFEKLIFEGDMANLAFLIKRAENYELGANYLLGKTVFRDTADSADNVLKNSLITDINVEDREQKIYGIDAYSVNMITKTINREPKFYYANGTVHSQSNKELKKQVENNLDSANNVKVRKR